LSTQYQLVCEYMHCKGIHTQVVKTVETEAEARAWVEYQRNGGKRPITVEYQGKKGGVYGDTI